jgi:hypothetical protein
MYLTNSQEIISQALRFAGESPDLLSSQYPSEFRADALTYLNRMQLAILSGSNEFNVEMGEPFPWALEENPLSIKLKPSVTVNVNVTSGSTTITFSQTPSENFLGRYIRIDGSPDFYRIVAHVGLSTTATIDFGYIGSSATGLTARIHSLDYSLGSDIVRLAGAMRITALNIPNLFQQAFISDMDSMLREFPLTYLQTRMPDYFAIKSVDNSTNSYTIRINTTPNTEARGDIDYVKVPPALTDSVTSVPKCPLIHRIVLAYGVAYYILRQKNDDQADVYFSKTQLGLNAMVKEAKNQRSSSNFDRARLIPRREQVARIKRPWFGIWNY